MHKQYTHSPYIGRFAPSPSGPLHFGSLVTALASYVDARHHHGQWLVRMEDIDPPREINGAQEMITESLLAHGLQWDGKLTKQSEHLHTYQEILDQLLGEMPKEVPVILDAKRSDIGETQKYYARSYFENWGVDAVTLNPFLGYDTLEPFLDWEVEPSFLLFEES